MAHLKLLIAPFLLSACIGPPNSLRADSPLDGSWIASVSSPNCGIAERFPVTVSGRVFGERIPGTDILLSGIERGAGREPASTPLAGGAPSSPEVVRVDLDFASTRLARGIWRSSRCGGTLLLTRNAAG